MIKNGDNMKKKTILSILIILIIIVGVIIFRYDKSVCINSFKEENYAIINTYNIYHKKDIVHKVVIKRQVESKNNTVLEYFEKQYKEEFNKYNKEQGGCKIISSTIKGNKYTLKVEIKFKKENVSKISKNKSFLKENIIGDKIELEGVYKLFGINKESCD